jgi:uracil-DNA glycosylase family 4
MSKYSQTSREEAIARLNTRIKLHPAVQAQTRYNRPVVGEGAMFPKILLLGDCPDAADEVTPGALLNGAKAEVVAGLRRSAGEENTFYANSLFWRPLGPKNLSDRKPTVKELAICHPFVCQLLDILRPTVIVTLGATPLKSLLPRTTGIKSVVGTIQRFRGYPVLPLFDPEYVVTHKKVSKRAFWESFLQAMRLAGINPTSKQQYAYLDHQGLFASSQWSQAAQGEMVQAAAEAALLSQGKTLSKGERLLFERFLSLSLSRGFDQITTEDQLLHLVRQPISNILGKRTLRALYASNIQTYEDLLRYRPFTAIPRIGAQSSQRLHQHLTDIGIPLNLKDIIHYESPIKL